MKVEIWSDIACPFCYIGKAHFDKALASFENAGEIEVDYRAYQLDPEMNFKGGQTAFSYLTKRKGMPMTQVEQLVSRIIQMAADAGLKMDFKTNIPANTLDAHRLIQLAIQERKEKAVIEELFEAHFTNGKNIEDKEVLKTIGVNIGLDAARVTEVLNSDEFAYEVKQDIMESRNLGVSGVPFFMFNGKYAVSGAQPVGSFTNAIEKSFQEWRKDNPEIVSLNVSKGSTCSDSSCEILN